MASLFPVPLRSTITNRELIKCTSECRGIDLQQRYDVFAFDTFANHTHGVVIIASVLMETDASGTPSNPVMVRSSGTSSPLEE